MEDGDNEREENTPSWNKPERKVGSIDADEACYMLSADEAASPRHGRGRSKSILRGISEDIAESMEI